jgi:hypothetical protein
VVEAKSLPSQARAESFFVVNPPAEVLKQRQRQEIMDYSPQMMELKAHINTSPT